MVTTPDPTTPDGLRDQIAEALPCPVCPAQAGEPCVRAREDSQQPHMSRRLRADAVMHVIEPYALAITVDATRRADLLAGRLQEALDALAGQRRATLTAQAAVRRVRELGRDRAEMLTYGAVLNALDAEGQQDETLAEVERQRDDALAALTRHAAHAHRRKWVHADDNQAAFDELHWLGDKILADRDRLIAALRPEYEARLRDIRAALDAEQPKEGT